MGIGNPVHLMFIAAVALIVLGPKRLPDLARSLGNGMREFRESLSEAAAAGADEPTVSEVPAPVQQSQPSQQLGQPQLPVQPQQLEQSQQAPQHQLPEEPQPPA
jgi:TatA/E family protein of Tat protein translocase